jgi:protein TonB
MPHDDMPDVFTIDELARAAGVPRGAVLALVTSGDVRFVPGTGYIAAADATRSASMLRNAAVTTSPTSIPAALFARVSGERAHSSGGRLPLLASSFAHAALLAFALWVSAGTSESAAARADPPATRLVFLMSPGPGGGGGGGGARQRAPAPRLERRGAARERVSVPDVRPDPVLASRPAEPARPAEAAPDAREDPPEPLAARTVVAPVVVTSAGERDEPGVVEETATAASQGTGVGNGAGAGRGAGHGDGVGAGIGEGAGGGTGGGPYRPGSGIEPPRLLREVKAEYTEEARRRGITGSVMLEIVVTRDGTVEDVTVRRGLGGGLDERAAAAVRQWRFAPARRLGEAVDVIVQVSVDFSLR